MIRRLEEIKKLLKELKDGHSDSEITEIIILSALAEVSIRKKNYSDEEQLKTKMDDAIKKSKNLNQKIN